MIKTFSTKKLIRGEKNQKEQREYSFLSRRASAFERFAGEFADTSVSYQNINGSILPLVMGY